MDSVDDEEVPTYIQHRTSIYAFCDQPALGDPSSTPGPKSTNVLKTIVALASKKTQKEKRNHVHLTRLTSLRRSQFHSQLGVSRVLLSFHLLYPLTSSTLAHPRGGMVAATAVSDGSIVKH